MTALFPTETQSRELDYKLILAHYCASKHGVKSYVGSVPAIHSNIENFKNGLYFSKTIFSRPQQAGNQAFYRKVKSLGFDIAYLHEEGAVWNGKEADWINTLNKMYDLSIFDDQDIVMLWGEWQKHIEQNRNRKKIPLYVTGNPRFDLLKEFGFLYQNEVEELKGIYGDYVLISGKYSIANHGESFHKATSDVLRWHGSFDENLKKFYGLARMTADKMFAMVELVANLALKFPDVNFIFRPHPSERLETYNDLFSRLENVKVIREGSANKYILGAIALIHDGCTTSLEAANTGIPILNYVKVKYENDVFLTSQIGDKIADIDQAIQFINLCVHQKNEKSYSVKENLALSLLMNLDGRSSFQEVKNLLDKYFQDKKSKEVTPSNTQLKKWFFKYSTKIELSNFKNSLTGRKDKIWRNKYLLNKFPGMSKNEIEEKVQLLNNYHQSEVKLKFINSQIIYLE